MQTFIYVYIHNFIKYWVLRYLMWYLRPLIFFTSIVSVHVGGEKWQSAKFFECHYFIINNNFIEFDLFHKPKFSDRYLNYEFSTLFLLQERNDHWSHWQSVFTFSSKIPVKNLESMIKILLNNGYSLIFILYISIR